MQVILRSITHVRRVIMQTDLLQRQTAPIARPLHWVATVPRVTELTGVRCIQQQQKFIPAYELLAEVLIDVGKLDDALALYDQALEHAPDHTDLLASREKVNELRAQASQAAPH